MIECSRKIDFDAGHRVIGHKNKCKYLHGHRYTLEITAAALELDEIGMVADFGFLKKIRGRKIIKTTTEKDQIRIECEGETIVVPTVI